MHAPLKRYYLKSILPGLLYQVLVLIIALAYLITRYIGIWRFRA